MAARIALSARLWLSSARASSVLARNVLQRRDGVGADALVALRMAGAQAEFRCPSWAAFVRIGVDVVKRHHLGAARDRRDPRSPP